MGADARLESQNICRPRQQIARSSRHLVGARRLVYRSEGGRGE